MFRCKDIAEHASAYIDRTLTFVERMQFQWHLLICHHCRRFIAQFRCSVASLVNLRTPPPQNKIAKQVEALKAAHKEHSNKE